MKKRILVAPLNWGIGHACRCIPIINSLLKHNFDVVIASDNEGLLFLKKEFPKLSFVELPAYNITYSKDKNKFKHHLIRQLPMILKAIKAEYKATRNIVKEFKIDGIISDNRLGVYNKNIYNVFITHQLNVLTGSTSWISTRLHHFFIRKFNSCWVPDFKHPPNLSGALGHSLKLKTIPIEYIGALSRFKFKQTNLKHEVLILLSGPEPQRTILEKKLILEFKNYKKPVILVKGIIENNQKIDTINNITLYNFLTSKELEKTLLQSNIIICRSGYTSIMDLAKLKKSCFFIPTPGQFEQEYLATYLERLKIAPFCNQDKFKVNCLETLSNYTGFHNFHFEDDLLTKDLFRNFG